MGYYTHARGYIAFEPPLPEESESYLAEHFPTLHYVCGLKAEGLDPDYADEGKAYQIESEFEGLAEFLAECDVEPVGTLVLLGEGNNDIRRVRVHDKKFVVEKAIILWPDGTPVTDKEAAA